MSNTVTARVLDVATTGPIIDDAAPAVGSVPLHTNLVLAEARAASVPVLSAGTGQISASVEVVLDLA